jgi:hypothetical protein
MVEGADYPQLVADNRAVLARFTEAARQAVDENDDGLPDRVEALLDHTLVVTGSANSELLPIASVNELKSVLVELKTALEPAVDCTPETIDMDVLKGIKNRADALAMHLSRWPRTEGDDWREAVTQAASTYRRSLGQQLGSLQSEIDALRAARAALGEELEREQVERRASIGTEFSAFDERLDELETKMTQLDSSRTSTEAQLERSITRSDEALAAMQKQFSDAQEARTTEAAAVREKMVADTSNLLAMQESNADSLLQAIQEHVDSAASLVSVFAAAGTANAYSKEAKEQGDKADNWRIAAIVLGILAGVAAGAVLFGASRGDAAWQLVIGKLAIGIVFGGIASYAARQSARHRRREESARHLELNLATFGSLADELDSEQLQKARAELVAAMLKREVSQPGSKELDVISVDESQINFIQRIIDLGMKQRR